MIPLSLDDLVPLHEYAAKRREYFESHQRYLDRYRRVRVGPNAMFHFENRQTLWFRVQEFLRIARLNDPRAVQRELDMFNCLLPGIGQLQAALLIEIQDESQLAEELTAWSQLSDNHVHLCIGKGIYAGNVLTCRPEDRCIGTAHWVQFSLDGAGGKKLADFRKPAFLEITLPAYRHRSALLSDEIRQSLVEDMKVQGISAA
jgi:Protein of unknown function (DUF3501)